MYDNKKSITYSKQGWHGILPSKNIFRCNLHTSEPY